MKKLLIVLGVVIYIAFPADFIPDFIPVLGWGDDLGAAIVGLKALLSRK